MTLNNIEALFKDLGARHQQINSYYNQKAFDITAVDDVVYPALVINTSEIKLPRTDNGYSIKNYAVELQVIDLVHKDESNKQEVLSDADSILNDIVAEFSSHPEYNRLGIDLVDDIVLSPLRGAYGDEISGWNTVLNLEVPLRISWCGSPLLALAGFDSTVEFVSVIDGQNPASPITMYSGTYTCIPFSGLTVSNSNDSYTQTTANNLELPDTVFTDSDGTISNVPATNAITATPQVPQASVNISNSNDSYIVDTLVDLELPNISFTDSDGVITSVPSQENITATPQIPPSTINVSNSNDSYTVDSLIDVEVSDSTVSNSNDSYISLLPATESLELPNISFTDGDGTVTSVPSMENIIATPNPPINSVNVSNSNDTYIVDTIIDLELPDVTHTDTYGGAVILPSQTSMVCTTPAALNVSNFNDTYNVAITSDLELPNINVTDSDGTITSVPSMENVTCTPQIPQASVNISNFNDSYSVDTLVDLELPNISFTDSDGIVTSVPSMEDVVATACVIPPVDFTIDHSFLFDGVNERFIIPNTELESYFAGTNDFTVSALFNINSLSTHQGVFGNENLSNGFRTFDITILTDGRVACQNYTSGFKALVSTVGDISINEWVLITVVVDKSNQSNRKIYKNGVPLVITSNTLPSNFTTYAYNYNIGDIGNGQYPFNGNISQVSVIDRTLSGGEVLDLYNAGKPKDPQDLFTTNCKAFFNPDNSGATAEFTITDSVNSVTATSINLENTDKTTTTPY